MARLKPLCESEAHGCRSTHLPPLLRPVIGSADASALCRRTAFTRRRRRVDVLRLVTFAAANSTVLHVSGDAESEERRRWQDELEARDEHTVEPGICAAAPPRVLRRHAICRARDVNAAAPEVCGGGACEGAQERHEVSWRALSTVTMCRHVTSVRLHLCRRVRRVWSPLAWLWHCCWPAQ